MGPILFIFCMAVATMLFVWGLTRLFFNSKDQAKRRLKQRLGTSGDRGSTVEASILLAQESSGLSASLATQAAFQGLARKLSQAYPGMTLIRFLVISVLLGSVVALIAFAVLASGLIALVAGAAAGAVPYLVISSKTNAKHRLYNTQLPESLDFLSRILRAGHSLSTGLQMMGTELPDPLASEFRRTYDQHSLGQPLEQCLKDMAVRIESTDFAFFVTAVLIQRQTGGDLSMVLTNISAMIRSRIRLQQYVKAKTAEGRFTGYILVAFPLLMFFIAYSMNPDYAGVLLHSATGLKLLATAVGLQLVGLFFIRILTTVKV